MTDQIKKIVYKTIEDYLGVEASRITDQSRFEEDLGADSLDVVELIMAFEEEFEFIEPVPDDDIVKLKTIQDVVNYITNTQKKGD